MKLTNEKMLTFSGHEKINALNVGKKMTEFGESQNAANEVLAANINDLIKRVCALEEKQIRTDDVLKAIATELKAVKKELDRQKLSNKLNNNTIKRLNDAIKLAEGGEE